MLHTRQKLAKTKTMDTVNLVAIVDDAFLLPGPLISIALVKKL